MTDEMIHQCSLFGICGGCTYGALSYEEQLAIKDGEMRKLIEEAQCDMDRYEGILGSPLIFAYRNKMEFSFGDSAKNGPLTLGLHKKKSFYDIVDTDCCLITHEDFNEIQRITREYFGELGLTYMDKRSHLGYLRHLLVRRGVRSGEILIDLVTTTQPLIPVMGHRLINDSVLYDEGARISERIEASTAVNVYDEEETLAMWVELLLKAKEEGRISGELRAILHTKNDRPADAIINEGTKVLYGSDHITEELCGLKFKITPFSFFQTNTVSAELIYNKAIEYISDGLGTEKLCFDLFSGTGTITQILALHFQGNLIALGAIIVVDVINLETISSRNDGLTTSNSGAIPVDTLDILQGSKLTLKDTGVIPIAGSPQLNTTGNAINLDISRIQTHCNTLLLLF